jgi:D-glycero-D-manno-heptose 1,7-bisphosphate phosphatase
VGSAIDYWSGFLSALRLSALEKNRWLREMFDTIFFDRDGVINEVVLRDGVVSSPRKIEEFSLRADFIAVYEQIAKLDLNCFVVSNQPDVRRHLLSEQALSAMTDQLSKFRFKEIIYCKHDNEDNCLCRKPKPGMLDYLIDKYNIDRSRALFVGDSEKDVLAGSLAGVKTVFFRQKHNRPGPHSDCSPDFIVDTLDEILGIINKSKNL